MRTPTLSAFMLVALAALVACSSGTPAPATPSAASSTTPATECPEDVRAAADSTKGGACVEPDVIGESAAKACSAWFESNHWNRDFQAEQMLSEKLAKHAICYRP